LRQLVLMRGAMGAGKSTWIERNNLKQYTLSADDIRLLFQTPVMTEDGKMAINGKNDNRVWDLLFELLEERMKRGEFTIIDATHAKQEAISRYKDLCQKYRYRCAIVDFSDVPLKRLLEQNRMRDEHKHVPEHVIMNAHERMQTEHVPKWVTVLKPDEFESAMKYAPKDFNEYKRIHHIGDVHGCYTALNNYFVETGHELLHDPIDDLMYPVLNEDEYYIFVGDLLDRGIENKKTIQWFLKICHYKNVAIVEGNHEIHLWKWAQDEEGYSNEFNEHTKPQLEEGLDEKGIQMLKKDVRQLYRKLCQMVYYTAYGKVVLVTHGGIAKLPDNLMYMATEQFIKGVGDYGIDIDNAWDKNLPLPQVINVRGGHGNSVRLSYQLKERPTYQIHGHRNIFRLPIQAGEYSFNLEGQVEFGGHLRAVILSGDGFSTIQIKNDVYRVRKGQTPSTINEDELTIDQFIEYLSNHKEINEKHLGDNIYSYNFTRNAFAEKIWDDINIKARGLFINKNTKEIVSRSYNKFFNVNERSFTKLNVLADNLVFPVQVFDKPNGYLGTVGYDSESDRLIFTSKSETRSEHAEWLKELFYKQLSEKEIESIKNYVKLNNVALVFEVIRPVDDPHIIEYPADKLVLLDIVKREIKYSKLDYDEVRSFAFSYKLEVKELKHVFDNWTDFYKWYRDVIEDFSIEAEGFVIEDASGFMFKIKLPYYNFWKQMRGLKDKIVRRQAHTVKGSSLYTPLHNRVFKWMKEQDPQWLKESSIVVVRKQFYNDKNAK